jgi:peptidoglycan/LPS O-acetylase OafA/YrhL
MKEVDSPIYLKGLNGIRAIAAVSVMIAHTNSALVNFGIKQYSLFFFSGSASQLSYYLGSHGVTMFFVLSGFLITFLLLKEINKEHKVHIKSFYIRRALRIWPLYFFYFFVSVFSIYFFSHKTFSFSTLLFYLFFLANVPFIGGYAPPILSHLWSIAVEEQFYLFWPHLFNLKKDLVKLITGLILFQWLFRIISKLYFPTYFIAFFSQVNRFDCMMMGGLLAILIINKSKLLKLLVNKYVRIGAWLVLVISKFDVDTLMNSIVEFWVISIITCVLIAEQVLCTRKVFDLENKIFVFFGVLSFGIYVYHPLVIYILEIVLKSITFSNDVFHAIVVFVLVFVLTILVAWISYNFLEKRFLKRKEKHQFIKSTNTSLKDGF